MKYASLGYSFDMALNYNALLMHNTHVFEIADRTAWSGFCKPNGDW